MYISGSKGFEIKQLLPAGGWYALFADNEYKGYTYTALIAWAYGVRGIESESGDSRGVPAIIGIIPLDEMGGEVAFAPLQSGFLGYFSRYDEFPPEQGDISGRLEIAKKRAEETLLELANRVGNWTA